MTNKMSLWGSKKDPVNIYRDKNGRNFLNYLENGEVTESGHIIDEEAKEIIRSMKLKKILMKRK